MAFKAAQAGATAVRKEKVPVVQYKKALSLAFN